MQDLAEALQRHHFLLYLLIASALTAGEAMDSPRTRSGYQFVVM